MSNRGSEFEALIARVALATEGQEGQIKKDVQIRDPDAEDSIRQVDLEIEWQGRKTFVECRDHKKPQDVKWIEELIGRRASLQCDLMIGTSSSGFTDLAKKKASGHGILLRTVSEVTDTEIQSWGQSVKIEIRFLRFESLAAKFCVCNQISQDKLLHCMKSLGENGVLFSNLRALSEQSKDRFELADIFPFEIEIDLRTILPSVAFPDVMSITIEGIAEVDKIERRIAGAKIFRAENCSGEILGSLSTVHSFDHGSSELIDTDSSFFWYVNLSKVELGRNCVMSGDVRLDLGRPESLSGAMLEGLRHPSTNMFDVAVSQHRVKQ